MELVDIYGGRGSFATLEPGLNNPNAKNSRISSLASERTGQSQDGQRIRSNEVLYNSSPGFYIPLPSASVRQVELKSPILSVITYYPNLDKDGNKCGDPMIVCGCLDGSIHVYSLISMERIKSFVAHSDAVTCLKVFQPEGEILIVVISGSKDKTVKLSVAYSGALVGELNGHTDAVWSLDVFLQYGAEPIIITGSLDGLIGVWSMLEKKLIRKINANCGAVFKVQLFASKDVLSAAEALSEEHETRVAQQKEVLVLSSGEDRHMRLWSLQTGALLMRYAALPQRVTDFAFFIPDGWRFHTTAYGSSKYVKLLRSRTGAVISPKEAKEFRDIDNSRSGVFASNKKKESLEETDARTWREFEESYANDVLLSRREAFVFGACLDGYVYMYLAKTGLHLRTLEDTSASGAYPEPIFSLGVYASMSYTAKADVLSLGPDASDANQTTNPLFSSKRDTSINSMSKRDPSEITTPPVQASDTPVQLTEADIHIAALQRIQQASTQAKLEIKLVATTKDGAVIHWNVDTGLLHKKFKNVHAGGAITAFALSTFDLKRHATSDANKSRSELRDKKIKENESAGRAATLSASILENYNFPEFEFPHLISAGADKILKMTCYPRTAEHVVEAYVSDLVAKVPKHMASNVPREFAKFPRTYLLAQEWGGFTTFFSGQNFLLMFIALKENNIDFLKTFFAYARDGFVTSSRTTTIMHNAIRLEVERASFFRDVAEGKNEYSEVGLKKLFKSFWPSKKTEVHNLLETHRSFFQLIVQSESQVLIRIVLNVWIELLQTPPQHFLDQTTGAHMYVTRQDLKLLANMSPLEFQYFLCNIKPVKAHADMQKRCNITIPMDAKDGKEGTEGKILQDVYLWRDFSEGSGGKKVIAFTEALTCFYLPLSNPYDIKLIELILDVSDKLQSLDLFDSEFCKTICSYGWNTAHGKRLHRRNLIIYICTLVVYLLYIGNEIFPGSPEVNRENTFCYKSPRTYNNVDALFQAIGVTYILYFIIPLGVKSAVVSGKGILQYFVRARWLTLELFTMVLIYACLQVNTNSSPNTCQCLLSDAALGVTAKSCRGICCASCKSSNPNYVPQTICNPEKVTGWKLRILFAVCTMLMFFRFLYFFRAYESTGKLVALIFEVAGKMKWYVAVIFGAAFAFAQANFALQAEFPLEMHLLPPPLHTYNPASKCDKTVPFNFYTDDGDDGTPNPCTQLVGSDVVQNSFQNFKRALLNAVGFMFSFDITLFQSLNGWLHRWALFLSCVFNLFVVIVLLNLLIAFISDLYQRVIQKGQAQWRKMQCKTLCDQAFVLHQMFLNPVDVSTIRPRIIHTVRRTKELEIETLEDSLKSVGEGAKINNRIHSLHDQTTTKFTASFKRSSEQLERSKAALKAFEAEFAQYLSDELAKKRAR